MNNSKSKEPNPPTTKKIDFGFLIVGLIQKGIYGGIFPSKKVSENARFHIPTKQSKYAQPKPNQNSHSWVANDRTAK